MNIISALILCACAIVAHAWVKEMENEGMWQGDIVLDPDEFEKGWNNTQYASIKGGRWPGGRVPYIIDRSITGQGIKVINDAISQYHKHTCLRFHRRTNENAYLRFYRGTGCSSPVGYRSRRVNDVSLATGCWYQGTVMHEIGHSMGLYHEQSRPDRDQYVTIIWNNIQSSMRYNFNKFTTQTIDSLGTPYDYLSMMHYGATAFGNGRRTIQTKDPSKQSLIGQRKGFSQIDIRQLGLMYNSICTGGSTGGGSTGGSCTDKDGNCQTWAEKGFCTKSHVEWMAANCCRSCQSNCLDKDNNCARWARSGYCKGSHGAWMGDNCCKSCRIMLG